ncbi:MAG: AAA family ATPase, partial [Myxococcota bacterium]|nr:AAA family ATPase [Myxococcota bacterium]
MSGLRVTRLALQDVGVIRGHVDLGAFDPQITLITGANETGKSTAVEALRCALFEKHNAGHAGIRDLQTHGTNLPPQVWVDFTVGGRRYALHKQFLKGAMAHLVIDDTEPLVGAEADEALWACLGSSRPGNRGAKREDMGIWGLLWVSQDEAAAADPGTKIGEETRGALQDV